MLLLKETVEVAHKEELEECSAKPCVLLEAEQAELPSLAPGYRLSLVE